MRKNSFLFRLMMAVLTMIFLISVSSVYAKEDKKKEEIRKKIEELQRKRQELQSQAKQQLDKTKPESRDLAAIASRYENLLENCAARKSSRCADIIYTLASLYYDQGRDNYIKAREDYEKRMDEYERNPVGPEPVNPVPDYSKSLQMYERLEAEYPDFHKLSEAYYQMGTIYLLMGDFDKTKEKFTQVVEKYPQSPRASGAHFRLSDLCYMEHDHVCAIKHLEKINENEVEVTAWEMVHYRKAEIYYNMGDLDKAVNLFYTYVDKCDAGLYPKKEFRDMAVEFMAISFSDMGNDGAKAATRFFKKIGKKSYEPLVMYTIGLKNRIHGQFDAAIHALSTALEKFPYYKDAPEARMALIECYVIKKEHEKANEERVHLVDDYGEGGEWFKVNKGNAAAIEKAQAEIRRALGHIAVYFHALAQKTKDKSAYEKAMNRYEEYFRRFPDDKWKVYEFRYNIAEIYNSLANYEKAAENYDYVAMADLSTFPEFKAEIDTLGMDHDEVEKMKKEANKPTVISQEDAGYNVIVALDNARKKAMAREGVADEKAYNLPETQKMLEYTEKFRNKFPNSSNSAEVLYLAGNIHYAAKSYDNAIRVFREISENYQQSKVYDKSMRMLANSYTSSGQYDMAMGIYRTLLSRQEAGSEGYIEVLDLAAGAIYKRAEKVRDDGDNSGAAELFKSIYNEFPTSKVADRGWFEAGVCYEKQKNYELAASVFEELPVKFPKSNLRERSYMRAADNYKTNNQYDRAAQVYQIAANNITKAEFAIPSLSSASECYQKLEQFDMAGKMFEMIYERYANDPKTPMALYNAGLIFEKGKLYSEAINVYDILAKRFPESEYSAEAFFSIGLCYENMGQNEDMANVFSEYAEKFPTDRYKQVQALVKAGDAFFNLEKFNDAEKNYSMAVSVYEKFNKEADIDIASIAKSYFKIGEIRYKEFEKIQLVSKSEKAMKNLIKDKTKALEEPAKQFAKAIELGVAEWTMRATHMIGMGFVDMADAVDNQTLFGSAEQKIASKIRILSSLDKYYEKAQEYFYKNIDWAHTQNIKGEYIEKSIDRFMEMLYRRGYIMEQVGVEFSSAPIPRGLSEEEEMAYRELLEEKRLESMDAALPKYEEGLRVAQSLGIAQSEWIEKLKERIREINPSSEVLNIQITEWVPEQQTQTVAQVGSSEGGELATTASARDEEFDNSMRRIQNIMNMDISIEEKIKQLNRIETDAKRNIVLEEEKIKNLKEQVGI